MPPEADRPQVGRTAPTDLRRIAPSHLLTHVAEVLDRGGSVVVPTTGSTGTPKAVVLSAGALQCSAFAVADRLQGHGQWLAALSPRQIGGLGVLVRSVLAGTTPQAMPAGSFTCTAFAAASAAMRADAPRYVSLVPTQVHRLLAEPAGVAALRSFDRVLIGGAALSPPMGAALTDEGVAWTHTYGMSETSGGCLYDGVPLPGVKVRRADDGAATASSPGHVAASVDAEVTDVAGEVGRLLVAGPILADGYLDQPELDARSFVEVADERWFRTGDLGHWDATAARWVIVGRADDVIITGGHKVHPAVVANALLDMPGIAQAAVVGVPNPEWGQAVAALVVPSGSGPYAAALRADPRGWVRGELRETLANYAIPWQVAITERLPQLPGGKVDYAGVETVFLQEGGRI